MCSLVDYLFWCFIGTAKPVTFLKRCCFCSQWNLGMREGRRLQLNANVRRKYEHFFLRKKALRQFGSIKIECICEQVYVKTVT